MIFKKIVAYLKYKTGLSGTLPAFVINGVRVSENNEPLVDIKKCGVDLFFGDRLKNEKSVFLRKSVADKIVRVAKSLPKGTFLIIYDAYRSLERQTDLWNAKYEYFRKLHPDESEEQIVRRTRAVVADPRRGYGGHQTGGATDVGLCDKDGHELDMGTAYSSTGPAIRTSFPVEPGALSNRQILYCAMKNQGFVNYPNEWWHFCYGDKMWAAYSNKSKCFYGLADEHLIER